MKSTKDHARELFDTSIDELNAFFKVRHKAGIFDVDTINDYLNTSQFMTIMWLVMSLEKGSDLAAHSNPKSALDTLEKMYDSHLGFARKVFLTRKNEILQKIQ